jgi:integrase
MENQLEKGLFKFDILLKDAQSRKSKNYYYVIRENKLCFTGVYKNDVKNANKAIKSAKVNNTKHSKEAAFNWAFDQIYGIVHNHKNIIHVPSEISKFTTRLDLCDLDEIYKQFDLWIKNLDTTLDNKKETIRHSRTRILHCFKALVMSGMRIGELVSIDFMHNPAHRFVENRKTHERFAEIVINTEKVCKKREIYIPEESYLFFINDQRNLSTQMIREGFINLRKFSSVPLKFSPHTLRRTFATIAYGIGIDVNTIAMCLGNTPAVCMTHYIISSNRNYDAFELVNSYMNKNISKKANLFFNTRYLKEEKLNT